MAAEVVAAAGHRVDVYDQRRSPARKFVLAGRGGLNITHSEPLDDFLDRYGPERRYLEASIRGFSPDDLRAWCAELGHETFVGTSGRVFPKEFKAVPLLRSWLERLAQLGVGLHLDHRWTGWGDHTFTFERPDGIVDVDYDKAVLALGGSSWPRVGGDGSWVDLVSARGIDIVPLAAANCGVRCAWSQVLVDKFAGTPLKNTTLTIGGQSSRGDTIITSTGLEGGPVYALSRAIREQLERGEAKLQVDLFPDLSFDALEDRLSKRKAGESTAKWFRRCGVSPASASLMREATNNDLPRDAAQVAELAKAVPVTVTAMAGIGRAISSSGGIGWSQVGEYFELVSVPNVHVVGEMLDWEAPTGGYLLQACFSTARWAAASIA